MQPQRCAAGVRSVDDRRNSSGTPVVAQNDGAEIESRDVRRRKLPDTALVWISISLARPSGGMSFRRSYPMRSTSRYSIHWTRHTKDVPRV